MNAPDTLDQARAPEAAFTVIKARQPERLCKLVLLDEDGQLHTEPGGKLVRGEARICRFTKVREFAEILGRANPAHTFTYGIPQYAVARVSTKKMYAERQAAGQVDELEMPLVTRTRENFQWPEGPGILMLDYDPAEGSEPVAPVELRETLYEIWPELRQAPHLWAASSRSGIVNTETGEQLTGMAGQRLYILVADARDIPRVGEVLFERLWLAGHGRYDLSKSGALLKRTLIDGAVFQPERIDFVGGAVCESPLSREVPAPEVFNEDATPIDTRTLEDLTPEERVELQQIEGALRQVIRPEQDRVQQAWIEERIAAAQERAIRNPAPNGGRPFEPEPAEALYRHAVIDKRLLGDYELQSVKHGTVTVAQLLDDPDRFHNTRFADPLEPDYGNDPRIAWINLRNAGRPYLYSHAHGGQRFTLHRALQRIELLGGELHNVVNRIFEIIKLDSSLFEHANELVRVNGANLEPMTPDSLRPYLTGLFHLIKFTRNGDRYTVDCPADLAKAVLGDWRRHGLPKLQGIITAPVMRLDGSVLQTEGYDPQTELLLYSLTELGFDIPAAPSVDQVRKALGMLWRPFQDFPFCSPMDRAVFLAALLTAVQRRVLPTAPGILIESPVAGAGKSLLASCLAVLAGDLEAALTPPTGNEEEMRKILLAIVREGRPALIIDNVRGRFASPALEQYLTSRTFSDRLLGVSTTVRGASNQLFIVTGNNANIVGDLNRRLLRCRIDPEMEQPYLREFDLDPFSWTREHRVDMVIAALTVLLGYRELGASSASGRLASYEAWSDMIRQAVTWVGGLGLMDVTDPAESIDQGYEQDEETDQIRDVLLAWKACFGYARVTAADLAGDETETFDETRSRLTAALRHALSSANTLDSRTVGYWLRRIHGRRVDGMYIQQEQQKTRGGAARWRLCW